MIWCRSHPLEVSGSHCWPDHILLKCQDLIADHMTANEASPVSNSCSLALNEDTSLDIRLWYHDLQSINVTEEPVGVYRFRFLFSYNNHQQDADYFLLHPCREVGLHPRTNSRQPWAPLHSRRLHFRHHQSPLPSCQLPWGRGEGNLLSRQGPSDRRTTSPSSSTLTCCWTSWSMNELLI
jgi:hypothetical protein